MSVFVLPAGWNTFLQHSGHPVSVQERQLVNVFKEAVMSKSGALKGLWFSFEIKAEEYVAFVSTEALLVHFQASSTDKRDLSRAYRRHQKLINAVAIDRFHNNAPRPVKLNIGDFYCPNPVFRSSLREEAIAAT
ncbi:DUF1488 family protein [Noviherbaspirillum aerium]|uniref:DUF1488 family protein n=1 Tax=Noviherbaspirillum aerium TaxID=2588497 RepID=UPI00178C5330|nr:DUF1488 family protein [Noviherbaspirillum aerium]